MRTEETRRENDINRKRMKKFQKWPVPLGSLPGLLGMVPHPNPDNSGLSLSGHGLISATEPLARNTVTTVPHTVQVLDDSG